MKRLILLSVLALTMLNCKNKEQKTEHSNSDLHKTGKTTTPSLDLGCYNYNDGESSISLEIIENDKEVKGYLTYTLAEKDKNHGDFTGKFQNDVLIANYTFQSEGKKSIRQVAFKVVGDKLIEGYGELNNDGTVFKDLDNIDFTSTMPLTKTDCNNLKAACLFENGKAYSELQQTCLELASLTTKLNPLKNGAKINGNVAYILFNSDNSKAEVFLPKSDKGIVLIKSKEGNWIFENYTLISWKGYVLQKKGIAIYGG